ncbi:uncharacterized protein FIBRA_06797 [Fibroporia radiculosa]|uniref:Transmembrane protein n=1 Tax=Fibroporia radiculosa TaxID=599839 RepID=J4GCI8_9APHY|nr:uncharacterized protein FIBRA_06797 [Fibroporia radiculosa]CCM04613.1 predicted protein [Fibroporia radiculosa]
MSDNFELQDFSTTTCDEPTPAPAPAPQSLAVSVDTESVLYWAWGAASILAVSATTLLLFPRFLLFLVEGGGSERRTYLTPLESFLARNLGILLVAAAIVLVLNVPSVPLFDPNQATTRHPLLAPLSSACAIIAFLAYNTRSVSSLGLLVTFPAAAISLWGFWVMLFEGTSAFSKKTGADKHTSTFLFGNRAAASAQKKRWKKRRAEPSGDLSTRNGTGSFESRGATRTSS